MLANRNQPIVAGLLSLSIAGIVGATVLPFNDRIEYRIGNRIESQPAWLVPPKAEFKSIERGYGGIKILLSLLATGGMVTVMLIARKEGELEPVRQRIKKYQEKAHKFNYAAEAAYQMAGTQMRYKKLAEADERAFEDELETTYCQSLGISPHEQQALLTGTATLESISNPGDKVEAATSAAIEPQSDGPKLPKLTNYPAVFIYGPQGSGKTFLAEEEIKERKQVGHKVTALDPHAGFNSGRDCEVVGAGMDYQAIDAELADFASEVKRRYERIRKEPNPTFQPWTFVCDEFTNWASRCKASGDFFQAALSDIRKAKMYVVFVSHARTLAGLGDAKGMAATRDAALLEIELLGQIDPITTEAVPKFEALVKLPGQSQADRTLVKLVKHPTLGVNESAPKHNLTETDSAYLDRVYNLEFDLSKPEPSEADSELLNQPQDKTNSESEPKFTPLHLTRKQALELIQRLRTELNQTQVIEKLWDCKKGGSEAWKQAYAQFKELTAEGKKNRSEERFSRNA